jgi:hypothetical protein
VQLAECVLEIGGKVRERPLNTPGATDQDVVGACDAGRGEDLARKRSKPPLHPVAHHRAADLLRDRKAETHRRIAVIPRSDEQDETGHGRAAAAVRGEKIRAARKGD